MYDHTQKLVSKNFATANKINEILNFMNTQKYSKKAFFSTSQRVKTNLCGRAITRKERSFIYDHTQNSSLIFATANKINEILNFMNTQKRQQNARFQRNSE